MDTMINKLSWRQKEDLLRILGYASYPTSSGNVVDYGSIKHVLEENTDSIVTDETDAKIAKRKFLEWWRGLDTVSEVVHNIVKISYLDWLEGGE